MEGRITHFIILAGWDCSPSWGCIFLPDESTVAEHRRELIFCIKSGVEVYSLLAGYLLNAQITSPSLQCSTV